MTDEPHPASQVTETSVARTAGIPRVALTSYPKLLYAWPLIAAGFAFWMLAGPQRTTTNAADPAPGGTVMPGPPPSTSQSSGDPVSWVSTNLERLGWVYMGIASLVVRGKLYRVLARTAVTEVPIGDLADDAQLP